MEVLGRIEKRLRSLSSDRLEDLHEAVSDFLRVHTIEKALSIYERLQPEIEGAVFKFQRRLEKLMKDWAHLTLGRLAAFKGVRKDLQDFLRENVFEKRVREVNFMNYRFFEYSFPILLKQVSPDAINMVDTTELSDKLYMAILAAYVLANRKGREKGVEVLIKLDIKAKIHTPSKTYKSTLSAASRSLASKVGNDLKDRTQFQILQGVREGLSIKQISRNIRFELERASLMTDEFKALMAKEKSIDRAAEALRRKWNAPASFRENLVDAWNRTKDHRRAVEDTAYVSDLYQRRAEVIARTEMQRAAAEGALDEYEQSGVVKEVVWRTGPEPCSECAQLNGKAMTLRAARGKLPLHHNCRCVLQPKIRPGRIPEALKR